MSTKTSHPLCRRRFLLTIGTGAVAAGLPIVGCGGNDLERLTQDVEITLADHPGLENEGETVMIDVDQLGHPLAVTRTGPDDAFIVTGTECNHQGCGVNRSGDGFACPCHGARFELDGSLIDGPATKGLVPYDYEVVDGVMTVFGG